MLVKGTLGVLLQKLADRVGGLQVGVLELHAACDHLTPDRSLLPCTWTGRRGSGRSSPSASCGPKRPSTSPTSVSGVRTTTSFGLPGSAVSWLRRCVR